MRLKDSVGVGIILAAIVTFVILFLAFRKRDSDNLASVDPGIRTAFFAATKQGDAETVDALLCQDRRPCGIVDEEGCAAIHHVAGRGWNAVVDVLLDYGADVNAKTEGKFAGLTPLHVAAMAGRTETVAMLLSAGADPNAVADDGNAPLHFATIGGFTEVANALLSAGAEPDLKDGQGSAALHTAVNQGHAGIVKLLIEHGADDSLRDAWGGTPLLIAAINGNERIYRILVEAGARETAGTRELLHKNAAKKVEVEAATTGEH